jgi:DNA helicase-2/ATP-dependent DNA helicase PcrA
MHKSFGEGVILSIEGQSDSARVQIHFDSSGTKWLVMAYANLEKL